MEQKTLEPVCSCGSILPLSLIDLLKKTAEEVKDERERETE